MSTVPTEHPTGLHSGFPVDPDVAAAEQAFRDLHLDAIRRAIQGAALLCENAEFAIEGIDDLTPQLAGNIGEDPSLPNLDEPYEGNGLIPVGLDLPDFVHLTLAHTRPLTDFRAALVLYLDGLYRHVEHLHEVAGDLGFSHYDIFPQQGRNSEPYHLENILEKMPETLRASWLVGVAAARRRAAESPTGYAFVEPRSLYGSHFQFPIYAEPQPKPETQF